MKVKIALLGVGDVDCVVADVHRTGEELDRDECVFRQVGLAAARAVDLARSYRLRMEVRIYVEPEELG